MAGETYQLSILLALKDQASKGLDSVTGKLCSVGRDTRPAMQGMEQFRREANRDIPATGLSRFSSRLRSLFTDSRVARTEHERLRASLGREINGGSGLRNMVNNVRSLRSELGAGIGGLGLGYAGAQGMSFTRRGVVAAMDRETLVANVKVAFAEYRDGRLDEPQMNERLNSVMRLATELGNRLPGETSDFGQTALILRQNSLEANTILNGALRAVSNLAVATDQRPQDITEDFARFGALYNLRPEEYSRSADLMSRLHLNRGFTVTEQIESLKYFQPRAGSALGLQGLQGADQGTRFLAFLRQATGLRGSELGTGASEFFNQFIAHRDERRALERASGVRLAIHDRQGNYRGLDNTIEQFARLRGRLSSEQAMEFGRQIAGDQGSAIMRGLVERGGDWREFNAALDRTMPMMDAVNLKLDTSSNKVDALKGSLNNLNIDAFSGLSRYVGELANRLNPVVGNLQSIAAANPNVATAVTGTLGVGSTLASLGGSITTGYAAIRILGLLRRDSSATSRTLSAIPTRIAPDINTGRLATGIGRARGILSRLPSVLPITLALVGLDMIHGWYNEVRERWERIDRDRREYEPTSRRIYKELTPQSEQHYPRSLATTDAQAALSRLNIHGSLGYALNRRINGVQEGSGTSDLIGNLLFANRYDSRQPYQGSWFNPLSVMRHSLGGGYTPFDVERSSRVIRQQTPELERAPVMTELRRLLTTWNLSSENQSRLNQSLEAAFPQAFADSSRLLAEQSQSAATELSNLTQPTQQVSSGFLQLLQPTGVLPGAFNNAGTAANSFAARVNNLNIQPPVLQFTMPGGGQAGNNQQSALVPSRSIGGVVERDGLAMVHAGNIITPARITRGLPAMEDFDQNIARAIMSRRPRGARNEESESGGKSIQLTYAPQITTTGGEADHNEFARQLAQNSRELEAVLMNILQGHRGRS